ncbi:MAG TPA: glucoamylase family protein [Ideonella sp.]|uniref:GH36-type glycosyl hydrolase domain-containing protein n=1 Tax=Ideonella sp. TaxID=1929293 RepID=UPI002E361E00|nr:glucoamylase family protein [Ideonella sp.]HEX5685884.1 glucoamylase family protein [Ideonella sp.]
MSRWHIPAPSLQRLLPGASPQLCRLLDGRHGPLGPPIRAEIFGPHRFAQHGRSLAETHRAERGGWRAGTFFPRLRSNILTLREAHGYIAVQAATGHDVSPAAEWLLDNFHLIEAQLKEIHEGLPRGYFRSLPVLQAEPLAGLPRIYGVAWAFVAHTDGGFDEDLLVQFLGAYLDVRELNLSEMWALPTTLRVVLIESLRRLAERVAAQTAAREVANLCCDRPQDHAPPVLDAVHRLLERRGVGLEFVAQVAQRAHDDGAPVSPLLAWLAKALPDPVATRARQSADQTADNLSVSNAVTSLRAIGDADWPDLVARTSTLMRLMLRSPVFEAEQVATRDQTLHGIERLALRSGHGERAVGEALLGLMQGPAGDEGPTTTAQHWLLGAGRPALVHALGMNEHTARRWQGAVRRGTWPVYGSALLLGSFGGVAWLLSRHAELLVAAPGWLIGLAAVLMLLPVSEAVIAVVNRLISESVRPQHRPRLTLAGGVPPGHRVMVVIPALLTDSASIRGLARRLRLHHLANPERHAQFALLSDDLDADTAQRAGDAALLDSAIEQIDVLNASHPADPGAPPRFILLHRERRHSLSERRWIGWERKRGKLEQLIAALADGDSAAFVDLGEASRIAPNTRYIVTLDSDTQLPPGRLRDLVGVAAHPYNQPRLDARGRRVIGGYGILQPRIVTPLPRRGEATLFHWLFSGQCGIDPYSVATSEVYQDLFGEGSFTGKGLLHVQTMHAVLGGRLPEGRVLSHDLIEGSMARCAAVTDVTVIEEAPFHADVAASRVHRWMRGDWQLLPFMVQPARYPLKAVNRWKMFDNLRRSLVTPASLGLLLLALSGVIVSPWIALALVLAAFAAGPMLGAAAGFLPRRDDVARLHFFAHAGIELVRALCGGVWHLVLLPAQAMASLDAIGRALWRMGVSRRHLLQWTTASSAQAALRTGFRATLRRHAGETGLALGLFAALSAAGTPHMVLAAALCALWAAAPVWVWWGSRPRASDPERGLSFDEQAYLAGVARDTWRLFERCVGPDDKHLPPDNLQTLPHEMVAHRTSPTNIGLYLLSAACARQFGWITLPELLSRLEATLATLLTLQRHRGHFLNWYDTQTGAPLLPMYLSTVDSGNLCGHLLATAEACRAFAAAPTGGDDEIDLARLQTVAQDFEALAWAPDFGFLYHRRRHLFHIGYRVSEQQLDAGFYDLLASESRLTSLLAIAKGDVPASHWVALGRPFFAVRVTAGLRSWSGSMFEYLMPSLVLDEPAGSVLHDASRTAVREHVRFGRTRAVVWGVSESAYAGRDHTLAYQYSPQGVPRLALRRTPPEELVVAPYATALAAQIDPRRARRNFAALEGLGVRGVYGFIEALDFTHARRSGVDPFAPVATFMAHHQGMSIVALANVLLGGVVRRWGMAHPRIEAVASLLHERAPREVSRLHAPLPGPPPLAAERRAPGLLREVLPGAAALEPTHVLSNGRYSVTLRANGAGSSRWGATGITRTRDDALRDACGSFFYLRWDRQPRPVSITQHPAPDAAAQYRSVYHADRVCFDASWPDVQVHCTVWVSPEDDIEFRQIELHNLGDRCLEIELMSAFELTLAEPRADEAHPAFSNLFVRAAWQPAHRALLFERRPRLAGEPAMHAAHFLADGDPPPESLRVQTNRQRWLGRNRAPSRPLASFDPLPPPAPGGSDPTSITLDTGLDPVCALAVQLRIAPRGQATLTFATAASDHGPTLQAVIDKYRQPSHVQRASLMSATLTGIRLRALNVATADFAVVQSLTTALVLTLTRPPARAVMADDARAPACDRRLLWRFGISGDRPILLVSAGVIQGLGLLRSLAQALRLWSWGGVACDLVVVNAEPASYQMPVQHEIAALRDHHAAEEAARHGPALTGLYALHANELSADELSTLQALARVRMQADGRPLTHHVSEWAERHERAFEWRHSTSTQAVPQVTSAGTATPLRTGDFVPGSGDFRFDVGAGSRPSRPWVNVLANPTFGCQVSEAGGGYTWAVNSRLNQLTAWSNDPVADTPSEWFLLQDLDTREVWSVAPSAWGDAVAVYRINHGQGHSHISHRRGELEVTASWCVDATHAVKQVRIVVKNHGSHTSRLRLVGIAEWMMGSSRADRATVRTSLLRQRLPAHKLTALLCTQHERSAGFGMGTAFLGAAGPADEQEDWSCDRRECFDARGRLVLPDHFGRRSGAGLDPCAALSLQLGVASGESVERVFLLGYADSPAAARQLATLAAAQDAGHRQAQADASWDRLLNATTVRTPDPLFDAMVNRWLVYQTVACRMWAKAGFYQAGGATGYRDQLQDAMALAWAAPERLREQIVLAASRQFAEGDVQHWWHAPTGVGVRTHFSDDLLWLAHACVHYLRATGDTTVLDERVPFLEGAAVPAGAEDLYETPTVSADDATVYEHAARAIDHSLHVGVHGLPLMGSGDWNDGMNRVGHEGRGESVWLGWFLCRLVADFSPLAHARGDGPRARRWEQVAQCWQAALLGPAWDGQWFKRAFFDSGQALGSHANPEARIDLIAQAWAVLSGVAPLDLQRRAMAAVEVLLVEPEAGLIRLLDPPLVHAVPSAGYIQAYPPGVRENGGQYSHAGVWALMARAELAKVLPGADDSAYRDFTWLSPAHRAAHPLHGQAYGLEPYAMAGDVYSQPPHVGRGGWSWYTGAAGWMHRAAIEAIFGLRQGAHELSFMPCLPSHWNLAELTLRRDKLVLHFVFVRTTELAALAAATAAVDLPAGEPVRLLRRGEGLAWSQVGHCASFVIPLLGRAMPESAPSSLPVTAES